MSFSQHMPRRLRLPRRAAPSGFGRYFDATGEPLGHGPPVIQRQPSPLPLPVRSRSPSPPPLVIDGLREADRDRSPSLEEQTCWPRSAFDRSAHCSRRDPASSDSDQWSSGESDDGTPVAPGEYRVRRVRDARRVYVEREGRREIAGSEPYMAVTD